MERPLKHCLLPDGQDRRQQSVGSLADALQVGV